MLTRVSSASSVRTASRRSSMSALPADSSTCCWWAAPNQSASSSAWLRMRWSAGAYSATIRWASSNRSGSASACTAASTSASVYARRAPTGQPSYERVTVPLTSLSHGAGCGCKLSAADLRPIVAGLPRPTDPRVLVDASTADDAAVVQLTDDLAIVQTADFFTPIVDDPYLFGRIAATNALSDIYAMGGTPISAINLVAFPLERLGAEVLSQILRGGADAVRAAGASIVGGHSIDDPEPKYGLAVTGIVHPDAVLRNAGGRPGDSLVLTKPLGTGLVSTALKRGIDAPLDEAVTVMTTLNDRALASARAAGASALTDVTGFGLLGHLHELALASGCAAEVLAEEVPAIEGVLALTESAIAGGTRRNREHAETFTTFAYGVPEELRWLVCDAMTSGGLLAAVAGPMDDGWVVGRLVEGEPGTITVA